MKNKNLNKSLILIALLLFTVIIVIYSINNFFTFTSGYNENNFNNIVINNNYDDVTKMIGHPFSKLHYRDQLGNIREVWFYSRSPLGLPYKRRWVSFSNGKVDAILKDYDNSMD